MICYARSGGTLLNQCLGLLPNVVILSELNPLGGGAGRKRNKSYRTVWEQAKNWYNIDVNSSNFVQEIVDLKKITDARNKRLIVRDWTFVNFNPLPHNKNNPSYSLKALKCLKNEIDLIPFAFVRDSIDVWLSRNTPPVEDFFKRYLNYVKELIKNNIKIFKYEDFCQNPDSILKKMCEYLDIKFSNNYKNYKSFTTVHGDIQSLKPSRGRKLNKIKLLPRKKISTDKITKLNNCKKMQKANKLLDYQTGYNKPKWAKL